MSLVIFFGLAFFIFISGLAVLAITFYHWFKNYKLTKLQKQESLISQESL